MALGSEEKPKGNQTDSLSGVPKENTQNKLEIKPILLPVLVVVVKNRGEPKQENSS